jgi:hypothetical protein
MDRDGRREWANRGTRRATVLSPLNSDERNGELSYQTAYDSFVYGRNNGLNRVEKVHLGRWTRKITTGDGIVLYKDALGAVAVESPDGRWHVTDRTGRYAFSSPGLDTKPPERAVPKTMVAHKKPAKSGKSLARAAPKTGKKAAHGALAHAPPSKPKEAGRKLASVGPATLAPAPAEAAPASAPPPSAGPAPTPK